MLDLALEVSLRSLVAAGAVGLVLTALRVRAGAARHAAWSAVMVTMLAMPALLAVVPGVDVPVPAIIKSGLDTIRTEAIPHQSTDVNLTQRPLKQADVVDARAAAESKRQMARGGIGARIAILALYSAGATFFLARILMGWIFARHLVRHSTRVSCDNPSTVLENAAIATPMTAGILSTCVLLPVEWHRWPDEKLRAVLAHENAHVARRDAFVALLARLNRAIFWFHPLAWWLERVVAQAAEHACDEAAVRQTGHPRRYAGMLLDMAAAVQNRGRRVSWQTLGVDGSGLLERRIARLLQEPEMARMSALRRSGIAVCCSIALCLTIGCRQQIATEPVRPSQNAQRQPEDTVPRTRRPPAAASTAEIQLLAVKEAAHAPSPPKRRPVAEAKQKFDESRGLPSAKTQSRLAEYLLRPSEPPSPLVQYFEAAREKADPQVQVDQKDNVAMDQKSDLTRDLAPIAGPSALAEFLLGPGRELSPLVQYLKNGRPAADQTGSSPSGTDAGQQKTKRVIRIGILNPVDGVGEMQLATHEGQAASLNTNDGGHYNLVPTLRPSDEKTVVLAITDADSGRQVDKVELRVGGKPVKPKSFPSQIKIIAVTTPK